MGQRALSDSQLERRRSQTPFDALTVRTNVQNVRCGSISGRAFIARPADATQLRLGKKQFCSRAATASSATTIIIIASIAFPVNFAGRVLRHDTAAFLRPSAVEQILFRVSSRLVVWRWTRNPW
jgi:hypothetical protein